VPRKMVEGWEGGARLREVVAEMLLRACSAARPSMRVPPRMSGR